MLVRHDLAHLHLFSVKKQQRYERPPDPRCCLGLLSSQRLRHLGLKAHLPLCRCYLMMIYYIVAFAILTFSYLQNTVSIRDFYYLNSNSFCFYWLIY